MSTLDTLAHALAGAFLAEGAWSHAGLVDRGAACLGDRPAWLPRCALRVVRVFPTAPRDRFEALVACIATSPSLQRAMQSDARPVARRFLPAVLAMGARRWPVPAIATEGELAAWLGVSVETLAVFCHPESQRASPYAVSLVEKNDGRARVLEAPRPLLKALQRRVLAGIVDAIEPHEAVHGFRRGRSVHGCASVHAGQRVVLRVDLAGFFPSVSGARVRALFSAAGYPAPVAWSLACLCTTRTPLRVWKRLRPASEKARRSLSQAWRVYRERHLPQGAPTSPALANLAAFGLDMRLAAAARAVGATYTRYADDLVFSGGDAFASRVERFAVLVGAIAIDEGFAVRWAKTRVMRDTGRQRVLGRVVNHHARASRAEYDALRATLYNCVRHGAASENRAGVEHWREHLRGRIAWVAGDDEGRRAKLEGLFARIGW